MKYEYLPTYKLCHLLEVTLDLATLTFLLQGKNEIPDDDNANKVTSCFS